VGRVVGFCAVVGLVVGGYVPITRITERLRRSNPDKPKGVLPENERQRYGTTRRWVAVQLIQLTEAPVRRRPP
jgi:hypothetical protein